MADPLQNGLYVAATPIGNLGDASTRLIETLRNVDKIYCEDTRHTGKLCQSFGIKTPRVPYHDHNAESVRPKILAELESGMALALVSDAGTPLISDPGYKLIDQAREQKLPVFAVPGPCAAIAALSVAGLPTDRFFFAGFPPAKKKARTEFLTELAVIPSSVIFYETPSRLSESLASMLEAFGDRDAAVIRELTKIHEDVKRATLSDLVTTFADASPKGEIVVIVGPPSKNAPNIDSEEVTEFLQKAILTMSVKEAASEAQAA
ncbi:MAG: 16S rRNA (cytidine(1402)-2'-O)-methyltransferase, partial [Pseudomonadota bacterium]